MTEPISDHPRSLPSSRRPQRLIADRLWAVVVLFALGVLVVWLVKTSDENTQPMPCDRDEVYVWEDYPTDAACVSNTDHEAHMGH